MMDPEFKLYLENTKASLEDSIERCSNTISNDKAYRDSCQNTINRAYMRHQQYRDWAAAVEDKTPKLAETLRREAAYFIGSNIAHNRENLVKILEDIRINTAKVEDWQRNLDEINSLLN